ncbi:hypothetical protein SAMN05421780_110144 [Flexibacter flexilis DSM 6793]|uniref:Uncharacterized protein n=1 Tax=Flexibacter flexilis DSM 6793 TaxID=927664 RepID=A0A1I1MLL0_9BACT|nr:hypothetical protein [Flexibacter flexilis]SFC83523.1 hypothetical protein SAMN05421780_110144 [Flexibacter flexilis DSM 6793]
MKTLIYNPSEIETSFCNAFAQNQADIQKWLPDYKIEQVTTRLNQDNPQLLIKMTDKDGDMHELVLSFIQKIDL